jgi:methylmalonyl-CoA/ethylmalonyl-CoA epimerase
VGDRSIAIMDSLDNGEKTAISRFLAKRGPGPFSITFGVDDVDATCRALRSKGARVLLDEALVLSEVRSGSCHFGHLRINFVAPSPATHGLVVELQEGHAAVEAPLKSVDRAAGVPTALNEVHCAVHNADAAARDLADLFGLCVGPEIVQMQPPEEVRFRNLWLGDRPVLAVIEPATHTSAIHRFLGRRGEGIFSVSLRVPDVRAYAHRVEQLGVSMLFDAPRVTHATRIGPTQVARAEINWVRPQSLSNRVLFEIQQYEDS